VPRRLLRDAPCGGAHAAGGADDDTGVGDRALAGAGRVRAGGLGTAAGGGARGAGRRPGHPRGDRRTPGAVGVAAAPRAGRGHRGGLGRPLQAAALVGRPRLRPRPRRHLDVPAAEPRAAARDTRRRRGRPARGADHLLAYGPATEANLRYWFTEGLGAPWRRVHGWLTDLGDRVREVTVDGAPAWAPSTAVAGGEAGGGTVVLVPGYDPWVLGPGAADSRVLPPARRPLLSAGRHPVLLDGRVVGTWRVAGADVRTEAIDDGVPAEALAAAVARLRVVLDGLDAPSAGTPGR